MRRHYQSLFARALTPRKLLLIFTATVVVCFVQLAAFAPTARAADASWQNGAISYNGKTYSSGGTLAAGDSRGQSGDQIYTADETSGSTQRIGVVLFASGTTPGTATTAQYSLYNYTTGPPTTYTLASPSKSISLTPDPAAGPAPGASTTSGTSTCSGDWMSGIGWILCPVSKAMASLIDSAYRAIADNFFTVAPLTNSTTNGIYKLWDIVRSFANIAFIIVFLIVIYSQVTSLGLSKYGIQKALPRLIISAILVNSSYWICSLGVDLSNVAGHSIVNLFAGIRASIGDPTFTMGWGDAAGYIMSGGAIGTIGFAVAAGGDVAAGALLLLGGLISALFSVVVAIAILAARQAIIVVFAALSPLAFVAFILPSTEKLFERWSKTFVSMLVMFPMFAVLFGGAQLAGTAIIQSANGNLIVALIGMITQIIPLAITPFLVKLSGGVLGVIANKINDPKKGLVDRAKNWTGEMAEEQKAKRLAMAGGHGKYRAGRLWSNNKNILNPAAMARAMDRAKRSRDRNVAGYGAQAEANWMASKGGVKSDMQARLSERLKEGASADLQAKWDDMRQNDSTTVKAEITVKSKEVKAQLSKDSLDKMHQELIAEGNTSARLGRLNYKDAADRAATAANAQSMRATSEEIAYTGMAKRMAEAKQKSNITERLNSDVALRQRAGGIMERGDELVHADAIAADRKQFGEFVSAREEIMKHFKVSSAETALLAKGISDVTKTDSDGHTITFETNDKYTREASVDKIFKVGSYKDVVEVVESTGQGGANYDYRSTVLDSLISSGKSSAAPFLNDKAFDEILNGVYQGAESTRKHVVRRIAEGRLTADDLMKANAGALKLIFEADSAGPEWQAAQTAMLADVDPARRAEAALNFQTNFAAIAPAAREIIDDPQLTRATPQEALAAIRNFLGVPPPAP